MIQFRAALLRASWMLITAPAFFAASEAHADAGDIAPALEEAPLTQDGTPLTVAAEEATLTQDGTPLTFAAEEATLTQDGTPLTFALYESRHLRSKARGQMGGAIAAYSVSGLSLAGSMASYFDPCNNQAHFCDPFKVALGSAFLGMSLVFVSGLALPLHRASNHNRRAARALASGDEFLYSRDLHRGTFMRRAGKNGFIATGVLGAIALGAGITTAHEGRKERGDFDGTRHERSILLAGYATAFTVVSAATSSALFVRGRTLQQRGSEAPNMQTLVAPVFYGDGAGLSLYMGF